VARLRHRRVRHPLSLRCSDDDWTDFGALAVNQYADPAGQLQAWAQAFVRGEPTDTLEAAEVEGEAGAGLVRATLNGKGVVKRLRIDASLMKPEEAGVLEDLVAAAVNDAKAKADQKAQETMKEVAGGLAGLLPPGFTPPF
jgi:hypothetical protein